MATHEIALDPSYGSLLAIVAFLKLLTQAHARGCVGAGLALSLNIAPTLRGPVETIVCRLDEAGRFQFAQEIARGDETHAFDYRWNECMSPAVAPYSGSPSTMYCRDFASRSRT